MNFFPRNSAEVDGLVRRLKRLATKAGYDSDRIVDVRLRMFAPYARDGKVYNAEKVLRTKLSSSLMSHKDLLYIHHLVDLEFEKLNVSAKDLDDVNPS